MREIQLDAHFHGLVAWDSLFHLSPEDQRRMLPPFRKHSAPNAVHQWPCRWEAIRKYRGEPLYHGSLDSAEYSELLDDNGFEVRAHVAKDIACEHHTIWRAPSIVRNVDKRQHSLTDCECNGEVSTMIIVMQMASP